MPSGHLQSAGIVFAHSRRGKAKNLVEDPLKTFAKVLR